MGWKVVNIVSECKLNLYLNNLHVTKGKDKHIIPIKDIDLLLIDNHQAMFTGRLICELAKEKVTVILCDEVHMPNVQCLPIEGFYKSAEVFRKQILWDDTVKGALWQNIVQRKILNQSRVLSKLSFEAESNMLKEYATQVLPHDTTNREGHAAKVYFNVIFGEGFSRKDKLNPINAKLNYGYAVIRSMMSQAIVSAGYDPRLGIFHTNIHNYFALSSDLMEVFRMCVDWYVLQSVEDFGPEFKRFILNKLTGKILINGDKISMNNAIRNFAREFEINSLLDIDLIWTTE